ncbi:sugar transferase [uncultured Sunxiuqinia sp.]|uniref:sugar transferase n=1 Tax=uncultured Sunxiuqinia sp. TaxID=1573825 RepID=UPI002AA90AC8|nr:sugar transferase [uncultured Sunxiuqinia sp.]
MSKKVQVAKYLFFDLFAAAASWILFYIYRKVYIEPQYFGTDVPLEFNNRFFLGLIIIPALWILFYYITGYYSNIYRKSRLIELGQTFLTSLVGVLMLFFALMLDDFIGSYKNYYSLFLTLLGLHFGLTYIFRLIQTSRIIHRIHNRKFGFNTLLVGGDEKALKIYKELNTQIRPAGYKFIGFLSVDESEQYPLEKHLPKLGSIHEFSGITDQYEVEEVIIAIESTQHDLLSAILTKLQNRTLTIWGIPDLFDLLSGSIKTNGIFSSPLLKISNGIMPAWQANMKRLIDVSFSILAIFIFLPAFLLISILIKLENKGPILYTQKRIGRFGKPFTIYKFRTMIHNAETNGPKLSSHHDDRITKIGQFLRRTHLDEIPQFYNVIIGEMSLVGPRPERKYFIDQIVKIAPHYTHLHKIRPGITSWGQVKYGYASTLNEMLERLPYDMVYLKNISLYIDFKILIYTIIACFKGDGK